MRAYGELTWSGMTRAWSMAEVRAMSDDDLVRLHDQVAEHTALWG